jgi:uncharacterized protein
MASKLDIYDWIAMILVFIGAINWGLAVFDINLVTMITGTEVMIAKVIYGLVGLAGIYLLWFVFKPES